MHHMSKNIFSSVLDYSEQDCVILCLDFSFSLPSYSQLRDFLSIGRFTSLIILIKCNFSYCSKSVYFKVIDYINTYLHDSNFSVRLISNMVGELGYQHSINSMCKLLSLYIKKNTPSKIILRSVPLTEHIRFNTQTNHTAENSDNNLNTTTRSFLEQAPPAINVP